MRLLYCSLSFDPSLPFSRHFPPPLLCSRPKPRSHFFVPSACRSRTQTTTSSENTCVQTRVLHIPFLPIDARSLFLALTRAFLCPFFFVLFYRAGPSVTPISMQTAAMPLRTSNARSPLHARPLPTTTAIATTTATTTRQPRLLDPTIPLLLVYRTEPSRSCNSRSTGWHALKRRWPPISGIWRGTIRMS